VGCHGPEPEHGFYYSIMKKYVYKIYYMLLYGKTRTQRAVDGTPKMRDRIFSHIIILHPSTIADNHGLVTRSAIGDRKRTPR